MTQRQTHAPDQRLFVDYSGQTLPIIDPGTGEVRQAQLFVAVLGASNTTYVEASWSEGLGEWIGAHVRCLEFLGGVPEMVVPDNLRSGVRQACFYAPDLNPTYQDLAGHYGVVVPTRVGKSRDKAKVDAGVLLAQR